jgi:hypothetical protein
VCADFKGEFKLGNGHYCYPLTVTDHAPRLLLLCEALESTREDLAYGFRTAVPRTRTAAFHSLRQRCGTTRDADGVSKPSETEDQHAQAQHRQGGVNQ